MLKTVLKLVLINILFIELSYSLRCLSETGEAVDWLIVYKVPKLETSTITTLKSGFGYAFITDKSAKEWTLSDKQINQKDSIFGQTIGSLIKAINSKKSSTDTSYVVYNDQTPDKSSSAGAHSKGLFAFNSEGGFWLSHSVPRFPAIDKSYDFPDSAKHNGQTAICVSIDPKDVKTLNSIAIQLLVMRPNIYGINIDKSLTDASDLWSDLKNKKWIKNMTESQQTIRSKNGLVFTTFSKSSKYEKDLYSGLIANYFKRDLLVQSWRNGAGEKLDSDCTDKYKVNNIDKIQISNIKSVDWLYTEDHSKWVITSDSTGQSHTCIADINRMKSQFKRGGGSLCIASDKVWNVFKKSVETVEGCPRKSQKSGSQRG